MLLPAALWALLCGFVNKSEVLSHVTQRVVDGIRARPDTAIGMPVVVVIDYIPTVPSAETVGIDATDWLRIPPPSRFMVYADEMYGTCLIGVFLDAIDTAPAVISWVSVDWDSPVEMELPTNALGAFFAILDDATDSLSVRRVDWFGAVDGYEILSLRDEFAVYR